MVLLLTPPFDHTALEPGYIKGYVPGVRENGAQYTHAAVWAVIAFAELGDGDKAAELLGDAQSDHARGHPRGRGAIPRRAVRRRWATCTPRRRTSAAAGGRGTAGPPAGSIAPASNGCSACACGARDC